MKDEERGYNDYEETNSGRLSPSSFRSAVNDVNSIRDRINRRRHNPNSNTPLSNGLDDNPLDKGKDLLSKEGIEKGKELSDKASNVAKGAKTVISNAAQSTKAAITTSKIGAFIINGGWIFIVIGALFLLMIVIALIFSNPISNFSSKFGTTNDEAYNILDREDYIEGSNRETIEGYFNNKYGNVCGNTSAFTSFKNFFGFYNLENPSELCLYMKNLLEKYEKDKNITTISPGLLFNVLFYAYDTQNLDENGNKFITPDLEDNSNVSDFDTLSLLISHKIFGNDTSEIKKTIETLFDNYFYHEEYKYYKWEIDGYDKDDKPIYVCNEKSSEIKDYIDENRFKLYLRYGTDVAKYFEIDRNAKQAYDHTDSECYTSLERENPDMSKYEVVANLNYDNKDNPKITVDTGEFQYKDGFIFTTYPRYMPKYTISKIDPYVFNEFTTKDIERVIEDIIDRADYTNYFLGYPNSVSLPSFLGFSTGGSNCGYKINDDIVNNLKVRLTYQRSQNSSVNAQRGAEIEGQELVDLEKYIMGVVYAESSSGGAEHVKAQAIAARSYLLGGIQSGRFKLTNENGNNIVTISNSTDDQTYCDPDKGCYQCQDSTYKGNITLLTTGTVPTGSTCTYRGGGLSSDSVIRSASKQVVGQYLVSGNTIKVAGYGSSEQNNWSIWARSGMSYEDILAKQYTDATLSKAQCVFASGEWTKWTQLDSAWASVRIGNKTVREVGCYMTSIAMLVADTAGNYLDGNFNPGTFATKLQAQGQFTSGGALRADIPTSIKIATGNNNLNIETHTIDMAENEPYESKVNKISSYLSQGYHILLRVKSEQSRKEYYEISGHKTWWAYAQHWVYVTGVDGLDIHMADPGSSYEIVRSNPYYLNSGLIRFIAVKINE